MTRPPALEPDQEQAWRAMARLMTVLPRAIDSDLQRRTGLNLTNHGVLVMLSESPGRQLRMGDLAELIAMSPSRITRVVQWLEAEGLVERLSSAGDRRSSLARLTDAGWDRLTRAWPDHVDGVRTLLFEHLESADLPNLTRIALRIVDGIEASGSGCATESGGATDAPAVNDPVGDPSRGPAA